MQVLTPSEIRVITTSQSPMEASKFVLDRIRQSSGAQETHALIKVAKEELAAVLSNLRTQSDPELAGEKAAV